MDSAGIHPDNGQLGPLVMEDGNLQIEVFAGELPQFIIEANDAVKIGEIEEARKILNKDSIEAFGEKLERDGCRTVVLLAAAKLFFDTNQHAEAEQWYLKIIEREPNAFVFNAIADICIAQRRISAAAKYRKKAVEIEPENKAYWLNYAMSLVLTGQRDEGLELLRKRVEMAPS